MGKLLKGFAGLVLVGAVASVGFYWSQADEKSAVAGITTISTTFGDWVVKCVQSGDGLPCEMSQRLVDGKTGRALTQFSIAWSPSAEKHALQITVPLGVWIEPGAALSAGEFKVEGIQFSRCLPQGCMIEALLEEPMLSALKSGGEGQLVIFDRLRKQAALPFSLNGFADAEARLRSDTKGMSKGQITFAATVDTISGWFSKPEDGERSENIIEMDE